MKFFLRTNFHQCNFSFIFPSQCQHTTVFKRAANTWKIQAAPAIVSISFPPVHLAINLNLCGATVQIFQDSAYPITDLVHCLHFASLYASIHKHTAKVSWKYNIWKVFPVPKHKEIAAGLANCSHLRTVSKERTPSSWWSDGKQKKLCYVWTGRLSAASHVLLRH